MHTFPKEYKMNKADAASTLQNILDTCDKPAEGTDNTPVKLPGRSAADFIFSRPFLIAVLCITLAMPLIFVPFAKNGAAAGSKADISIDDYYVKGGSLYIDLNGPFIDYSSIYAITPSGSYVYPAGCDYGSGLVVFDYDDTEWNIYVSDLNDSTVHMLLTPPQ